MQAKREIHVDVFPNGNVKIDAKCGFKGKQCQVETKDLEDSLGAISERKAKAPEVRTVKGKVQVGA